jgi:hypothetical protein
MIALRNAGESKQTHIAGSTALRATVGVLNWHFIGTAKIETNTMTVAKTVV